MGCRQQLIYRLTQPASCGLFAALILAWLGCRAILNRTKSQFIVQIVLDMYSYVLYVKSITSAKKHPPIR